MTLQPADILCWRVTPLAPWIGQLIGWGERQVLHDQKGPAAYYHVAVVSANTSQMYVSKPPKIDLYPIPDPLPPYIEVHRFKVHPTDTQLQAIFAYGESRRGRLYPFLGVLTAGWLSGNLEFCSQLAEDMCAEGQYILCPDIRFSTPDDVAGSTLTFQVQSQGQ